MNPTILGSQAQGFLIRFLHYDRVLVNAMHPESQSVPKGWHMEKAS